MKSIKNIISIIILLLAIPFIQSCISDDVPAGSAEGNISNYDADLATVVQPTTPTGLVMIDSDLSGYAYVMNPQVLTAADANQQGQRIFYTYTTKTTSGDDKIPYIRLNNIYKVVTKTMDALAAGETDTYGEDPIDITGVNISKAHLNLQYTVMAGSPNIEHKISLVAAAGAMPDKNGYISVELRHNAEGDMPVMASNARYISFTLESVPGHNEGTLKGFYITAKTLKEGTKTIDVAMNNSSSSKSLDFNFDYFQ